MNEHVKELLPRIRKIILEERVRMEPQYTGFGLSWLTWKLGPIRAHSYHHSTNRSRWTSSGLKKVRGHAQVCLAILAREGILFGRNHAEGAVQSYAHGETDKRFRIRITPQEATRRLSKMK